MSLRSTLKDTPHITMQGTEHNIVAIWRWTQTIYEHRKSRCDIIIIGYIYYCKLQVGEVVFVRVISCARLLWVYRRRHCQVSASTQSFSYTYRMNCKQQEDVAILSSADGLSWWLRNRYEVFSLWNCKSKRTKIIIVSYYRRMQCQSFSHNHSQATIW